MWRQARFSTARELSGEALGVGEDADRLDRALADLHGDDAEEALRGTFHPDPRVAVDEHLGEDRVAGPGRLALYADHEAGDLVGAVDGLAGGGDDPAAPGVHDRV